MATRLRRNSPDQLARPRGGAAVAALLSAGGSATKPNEFPERRRPPVVKDAPIDGRVHKQTSEAARVASPAFDRAFQAPCFRGAKPGAPRTSATSARVSLSHSPCRAEEMQWKSHPICAGEPG